VVDADLSDYFNTIPHGALMRCLSRRIADSQVLSTIRQWLQMPVVERTEGGEPGSKSWVGGIAALSPPHYAIGE